MICADRSCACGIVSDSLTITGSGSDGDPWHIDSDAFIICTSLTRPATPEMWQHIFETDTGRQLYWNGTHWVIVAGNWPSVSLERQVALTTTTAVAANLTFPTEIYDTDAFHAGTDHFVTVPAGLGGDYWISGSHQWVGNATGYRTLLLTVTNNNITAPVQYGPRRAGGAQMENTANNGLPQTFPLRLEAGAVVTATVVQTSGGNLDLSVASLALVMFRHLPALT